MEAIDAANLHQGDKQGYQKQGMKPLLLKDQLEFGQARVLSLASSTLTYHSHWGCLTYRIYTEKFPPNPINMEGKEVWNPRSGLSFAIKPEE